MTKDQHLFLLEDSSPAGLLLQIEAVVKRIETSTSVLEVGTFSHIPQVHSTSTCRCAVLALDVNSLKEKLLTLLRTLQEGAEGRLTSKDGIFYSNTKTATGKTAWLFPGFGSEFPQMFTGLQARFKSVEKWIRLTKSLLLNTTSNKSAGADDSWIEGELKQKKYGLHEIGPFGSITSLAIQEILQELQVPCDAMIGHSNGENSALIASGILGYQDDEQLLQIIEAATSLPKPEGEKGQFIMLSRIREQDLNALLHQFKGKVLLAMKNCPGQTVLYVNELVKPAVLQVLKEARIISLELYTDHPYHTEVFGERAEILRPIYHDFHVKAGEVPVYSCVDGELFPTEIDAIREKALQQWVRPVLFDQTLLKCYEEGFDTFIEIGPGNKLQGFVKDSLRGKKHLALSCSQRQQSAWNALLEMATNLWIHQIPIDISVLLSGVEEYKGEGLSNEPIAKGRKGVFLAHQELMQQFLQTNERITSAYLSGEKSSIARTKPELLAKKPLLNGTVREITNGIEIDTQLHTSEFPLVKDHSMGGLLPVIPFTLSMELIAEAAALLPGFQVETLQLSEVKGHSWLVYNTDILSLNITVEKVADRALVKVFDQTISQEQRTPAFEGYVSRKKMDDVSSTRIALIDHHRQASISMNAFYEGHLFHGPCFQSMHNIQYWNEEGVVAEFKMPPVHKAISRISQPEFTIPGPMLDSCGQLMAYWLYEMGLRNYAIFPFKADLFEQYKDFPKAGETLVCKARIQQKFGFVSGSFEFQLPNGQLIGRLDGFQLKMYQHDWIPPLLMNRLQDGDLRKLDQNFLEDGAGIWRKVLAKILLQNKEYGQWLTQPADWQTNHLLQILRQKEPLLC